MGVARQLLEAGADVEIPDNYGQSPFFMACWKGHADVAALLLEYDANKDCRTKTGITPLFQVCVSVCLSVCAHVRACVCVCVRLTYPFYRHVGRITSTL